MCGCSHTPPTGDLACNPGMCPDWESNWQPFDLQVHTQSTEQHQPGPSYISIIGNVASFFSLLDQSIQESINFTNIFKRNGFDLTYFYLLLVLISIFLTSSLIFITYFYLLWVYIVFHFQILNLEAQIIYFALFLFSNISIYQYIYPHYSLLYLFSTDSAIC